jgi:hypothetical protein
MRMVQGSRFRRQLKNLTASPTGTVTARLQVDCIDKALNAQMKGRRNARNLCFSMTKRFYGPQMPDCGMDRYSQLKNVHYDAL